MPRAKSNPKTNGTPAPLASGDVLTLAEAATYLRVTEAEVDRLAMTPDFPGCRVGDEWRFLKAALQDWLRPIRSRSFSPNTPASSSVSCVRRKKSRRP